VLILAVIGGSLGRRLPLVGYLAAARSLLRRSGEPTFEPVGRGRISMPSWRLRHDDELPTGKPRRWLRLNRETIRLIVPSWSFCLVIYAVLLVVTSTAQSAHYFNSVLTLSLFLAVLGLGQGAVMLTGGLDLSVPHTIAFTGVVLAALCYGSDMPALWTVPLVLLIGAGIGIANGVGIVALGIPPLVMTLAMNGIVQGAGLIFTGGMPTGSAPPSLRWLFSARYAGFSPAAYFLIVFSVAATLLLHRTVFGRRVIAVGNSLTVARLSGVRTGATLVGVYALSGFCAALVGILMTGFSGISFLSMGMPYLLPSIAAVLVGGTLATGGRGHYLAILGGAVLSTMVGTLVSGAELPIAVRDIVYGLVILGAVLMLRERREIA
jgi:ribose transport system permease protein